MIDEKETFKRFGYRSTDLKPQSNKRIIAICDKCGKIREISQSQYRSLCHHCAIRKEERSIKISRGNKGKKVSEITKKKISKATEGKNNPMYGKHHTEESKQKIRDNRPNVFGKNSPTWKGGKIKRICEICEKGFEAYQNVIDNGGGRFCSKECMYQWRSNYLCGENSPAWKGGKKKLICEYCSKEFEVTPSILKRGNGQFCSRECKDKWQSENLRGENNPNWKGGKVTRICQTCGKEFEVNRYIVKKGNGYFCSPLCKRKAIKIPTHHTKPELIFEEICKRNNLDFHYVGDGQLWIGQKGEKQLNPDFIEANGKKICVEVMGAYWHSPLLNQSIKEARTLDYRKKFYRKYKWQPIFIWDTDLVRKDAEQFVLNTLQKEGVI